MAGDSRGVKLTYQDYCRFPEDGRRHEILDGEHHVSAAPRPRHQSFLVRLGAELEAQIGERDLVYTVPVDVHLSEVDVLQPDVTVIAPSRRHILTETKVMGAPDLVGEVLSPSTAPRDRGLKKQRYARAGVAEYWIIDLEDNVLEQYVLHGGEYLLAGRHESEVQPRVAGLTHIRLDLGRLW